MNVLKAGQKTQGCLAGFRGILLFIEKEFRASGCNFWEERRDTSLECMGSVILPEEKESHALHFRVSILGSRLFVVTKSLTLNMLSRIAIAMSMSSWVTGKMLVNPSTDSTGLLVRISEDMQVNYPRLCLAQSVTSVGQPPPSVSPGLS